MLGSATWSIGALLALATTLGPVAGYPEVASARPAAVAPNDGYARGAKGCVVAADPRAARIGLQVLEAGGNAVDAAVATALALAVCHPSAGNLGGGGLMVVAMADGRTAALDFREMAPGDAHRDMYLDEDGEVEHDKIRYGGLAGGVPGSPAGLALARERFGSMTLQELCAPAIALAADGFEIDHFLAGRLADKQQVFDRFPSSKAVFWKDDRPLRMGELLVQKDLADTLGRFAAEGFDGFYRGETARRFAAAMRAAGGFIDEDDLAGYQVREREVLRSKYRGHEVLAMPPVSSGGIALLQMLNMLDGFDLRASGFGSAATLHRMIEAMRRAYADRAQWLGDPDHWEVPVEGLISTDYADQLRASIDLDKVVPVEAGLPPGAKESDDTTHFSVIDAAGNAVSCTTTINSTFGSGMVVEGLGFLLNNEMDDFSAKPGTPNQFGLVGGEANAIQAGKRPLSSMTPVIVMQEGEVRYVIGSPGGGRIINTVLQVLINCIDHQLPLVEAVRAPRIHQQWRPEHSFFERTAISPDTRAILEGMGHRFAPEPIQIGRCQAIAVEADGTRVGVSDPRSGGAAAAY